jgi:hypothetical protein
MLENASYLKEDLAYIGTRTDVISVVLEVLLEELKDVEALQPIESIDVKKVNQFFKSSIWVMAKNIYIID